ncbi:MAG: FG-GAP repeat protein, partial [Nitrosopumilaceae archaeon]
ACPHYVTRKTCSENVFTRSGSTWTQQQKLTASDTAPSDNFARSVSISGDTAIAGAHRDDDVGGNSGSAYVFTRSGTTWTEEQKLTASDAALDNQFGGSVSISDDTAIVGAHLNGNDGGFASGAAYVFDFGNDSPDCSGATPSQDMMLQDMVWPPNHKMESVSISGVTDPDGDTITINIDFIRQDEPTSGTGIGDQSPDGAGVGTDTAQLRAERSGSGDGRVYEVSFTADDGKGGTCIGSVNVSVPLNQNGDAAVDSGQNFDSTIP